jgi:hypothetical protein
MSLFAAHLLRLSNGFAVDRLRIDWAVSRTADAGLLAGTPVEFMAALLSAPISIIAAGRPRDSILVIRSLIEIGFVLQEEIFLTAATDAGTDELSRAAGWPAGTVQGLLGWDALRMNFVYDENRPLPQAIIVVSDAARLSPSAGEQLARAARSGSRLIFMVDDAGTGILPEIEQAAMLRLVLPHPTSRP